MLGRVVSGTSATVEPRVLQPQDGADQRRGDIKVSKHGNTQQHYELLVVVVLLLSGWGASSSSN